MLTGIDRLTIKQKLLFITVAMSVAIYLIGFSYISVQIRQKALIEGKKLAQKAAEAKALEVESALSDNMTVSRTMAPQLINMLALPKEEREQQEALFLSKVLEQNPKLSTVWLCWELRFIDPSWTEDYGSLNLGVSRTGEEVHVTRQRQFMDPDKIPAFYRQYKANVEEEMPEPFTYEKMSVDGGRSSLWATTSAIKLRIDGEFAGVVGCIIPLESGSAENRFYEDITTFQAFDNSFAFLVSNGGKIISHPEKSRLHRPIEELGLTNDEELMKITSLIQSGGSDDFILQDASGRGVYTRFEPVYIGETTTPWSVGVSVPLEEITRPFNSTFYKALGVGLAGFILLGIIVYNFASAIVKSLQRAVEVLTRLAKGNYAANKKLEVRGKDELSIISGAINTLLADLNRKSQFSDSLSRGDFGAEYEPSGELDELGLSLIQMKANLLRTTEDCTRVLEEASIDNNLSARLEPAKHQGSWKELTSQINQLLETVSRPFDELNIIVQALAQGDLSKRLEIQATGDIKMLRDNLNKALDEVSGILHTIADSSYQMDAASVEMKVASAEMADTTNEMVTAIEQMNHGAESQVDQVNKSSMAVESIKTAFKSMSSKTDEINVAAGNGLENSENGLILAENAGASMHMISEYSKSATNSFRVLENRSNEIGQVLQVIKEIAAQTNLLALNAAIEAAQAGEAGRGFSVVAEEIRKLAEGSQKSAKEIEALVHGVRVDTVNASKELEAMNDSIAAGDKATNQAYEAFQEITQLSKATFQLSKDIYATTNEQMADVKEVVNATESVVVIAEEAAAGSKEIATSAARISAGMTSYKSRSEELSDLAKTLKIKLEKFQLREMGDQTSRPLERDEVIGYEGLK
ncbi:MAG: methyl-accepting chemotaxis protein [Bacteroidota bacterium]